MKREDVRALIKQREGLRLVRYHDTRGNATIGYGHRIVGEHLERITIAAANALLIQDVRKACDWACRILRTAVSHAAADDLAGQWVDDSVQPRYAALIDLVYNLGAAGVRQFPGMLRAWRKQDWRRAGDELLLINPDDPQTAPTPYARQVKGRAQQNAAMIARNSVPTHGSADAQ